MDFLGPHFGGGFPMELPQQISGETIAFAAQQLHTKIRFPCFVVQEKKSVQKLGRKKRKKKRKIKEKKKNQTSLQPKVGWLG